MVTSFQAPANKVKSYGMVQNKYKTVTLGSREQRTMTAQDAVVRAHQRAAANDAK